MLLSRDKPVEVPGARARSDEPVVEIQGLVKEYNRVRVLDNVSFTVRHGEIFGFLGPNGAGKTTTLEILEGLRTPTQGTVKMFGLDVHQNLNVVRERIGVSLQQTRYWGRLTARETFGLFQSLYARRLSIDALSRMFDLDEYLDRPLNRLSGGLYQRVVLALALVNDPDLVLLDEPTTGLDPTTRRRLWQTLLELRRAGKTVILTTHYMEEAHALCDRVAIIANGRIARCGTPAGLIHALGAQVAISFAASSALDIAALSALPWCSSARHTGDNHYVVYSAELEGAIGGLLRWAAVAGVAVTNIETRGPTLDDVFLAASASKQVSLT